MSTAQDTFIDPIVYRHTKRPDWGLAILLSTEPTRRRFQFQNGAQRAFSNDYLDMLHEVDAADHTTAVADMLRERDLHRARMARATLAPKDAKALVSFDDQVEFFKNVYPLSFADPKWAKDIRGSDAKRHLKRHRDAVVEEAREALSVSAFEVALGTGELVRFVESVRALLAKTDLVRPADLRLITDVTPSRAGPIVGALHAMLHGSGPLAERIDAWIGALTDGLKNPTWALVTAPMALAHPSNHIAIRPAMFRRQATWIAPRMKVAPRPSGASYARLLSLARSVERCLLRAEMLPKDLLDVFDFMRLSLRPRSTPPGANPKA